MDTLGKRIKASRQKKDITQEDLAKILGIARSTLASWEVDRRDPDSKSLNKMASVLDVSVDYLLGGSTLALLPRLNEQPSILVPVLGTIRAGIPILAEENIEDYLDVPNNIKADYVLRVQGDSMVGAGILDGDLVVCKEAQAAFSGQIVVALHDQATGISEATLKYYFDNGKGPILRPANPNYPDIDMRDGYRIAGVMVGLVRQDTPVYQVYKEYLTIAGHDEWTEVIEEATGAGITPSRLISLIKMLREMK